jgi:hypothetical protein
MARTASSTLHTSKQKPPLVAMAYFRPVVMRLRNDVCGLNGFSGSPIRNLQTIPTNSCP